RIRPPAAPPRPPPAAPAGARPAPGAAAPAPPARPGPAPADPRGPDAAGPARARRRFPALRRSPAAALVEAADHRPVAADRHGRAADRAVAGGADHRIVRLRPGPFGRFDVA